MEISTMETELQKALAKTRAFDRAVTEFATSWQRTTMSQFTLELLPDLAQAVETSVCAATPRWKTLVENGSQITDANLTDQTDVTTTFPTTLIKLPGGYTPEEIWRLCRVILLEVLMRLAITGRFSTRPECRERQIHLSKLYNTRYRAIIESKKQS